MIACLARVRTPDQVQNHHLKEINKVVKGLKIFTKHGNKKIAYTVDRIILETPQQKPLERGSPKTIADYFQSTYNIQVKKYPLMQTSGKKRFIPMELCFLVDKQFLSMSKMDKPIQNELLFKSTHVPNVYFDRCKKIVEKVSSLNPQLQNAFGLKTICLNPVQLPGRVLPAARMAGGQNRFFKAGTVPAKWGIFCFDHLMDETKIGTFAKAIADRARQLGLNFATMPNPIAKVEVKSKEKIGDIFTNLRNKTNAELIFIGIPTSKFSHMLCL